MAADKGKKAKHAERGDDEEFDPDHIDGELVFIIEKLQELQDELEKINEEANDKVLEVEQKYDEIRCPVYKRRNEIIQSIPDFWLTVFLSHPVLGDLFNEEDQKICKYLVSLGVEDFKDEKLGYAITINFASNPYFENTSLSKTFLFSDKGTIDVSATLIKWKEGMDITNGVSNKKNGIKRPFSNESFFSWFGETQQKSLSEGESDEVAEIIKEDLWPNPLKYFNNEADVEDSDDDDEEDDQEGQNSDEDEDEDEDEDSEEEE